LCDEVVIIDNNSSDNTPKIAKELVDRYPDRIKYYHYPFDTKPLHTKDF
jgi:glycosyltransferase involved in cell wall biosynthesis